MLALAITARLIQFAGAMALFGAPLFHIYATSNGQASRRMLLVAAWLVLLGAVVSLSAQTATMTGTPADALSPGVLWDVATGTQFGRGLLARLVLAAAFVAVVAAMRPGRSLWIVAAVLGAGVVASFSWTGHGGAGEAAGALVHRGANVVHLLAASAWLGALAALVVGVLSARRDAAGLGALHAGLQGFSGIGPAVVATLIVTGVVNSWFLVGLEGLGRLAATPYGLVLVAKLALFVLMLGLAIANRRLLTPRLALALERGDPASALAALRTSLLLETGLAVLVLAAVAALGALEPLVSH